MPRKTDPIEIEKQKLVTQISGLSYGDEKWNELIEEYIRLENLQIERRKVDLNWKISPKDIFQGGITMVLALLTLSYEEEHSLRSQVKSLWLKRPWK